MEGEAQKGPPEKVTRGILQEVRGEASEKALGGSSKSKGPTAGAGVAGAR